MTDIEAYRVKDFCQAYGIGRTKLYEEARNGHLELHKVGSRTLITRESAERWKRSLERRSNYGAG